MVRPVHISPDALAREDNLIRARLPLPQSEQDAARARLTTVLQTTLDLRQLVSLFFAAVQKVVAIGGLTYRHESHGLKIQIGRNCPHSGEYRLITREDNLGEIRFTRSQRFSEVELAALEMLISTLVYPLRNALKYREAVQTALRDPLTGMGNRAAMQSALEREVLLARRYQQALSLLVIDIDHFKTINDRLGHSSGDQVLREVAHTIDWVTRQTDMTFRYGGEEFVVVLNNTDDSEAKHIAERVRRAVNELAVNSNTGPVHATVSIGCSSLIESDDINSLFERGDKALYQAKRNGRNQVISGRVH